MKPRVFLPLNLPAVQTEARSLGAAEASVTGARKEGLHGFQFIKVTRHPTQRLKCKLAIGLVLADSEGKKQKNKTLMLGKIEGRRRRG